MTARTARPLSRARVVSCVLVNLAATPGLGSLMARRVVAGTGQLLLAVVGFCLIVGWMFELFHRVYSPTTRRTGFVQTHLAGWGSGDWFVLVQAGCGRWSRV